MSITILFQCAQTTIAAGILKIIVRFQLHVDVVVHLGACKIGSLENLEERWMHLVHSDVVLAAVVYYDYC